VPAARVLPREDSKQQLRLRRYFMAAATTAMVVALFFVCYLLEIISLRALAVATGLSAFFVVLFYVLFRSGLNRRWRDPSLTVEQILAASIVILYVLSEARAAHGALQMIYPVSFLFGAFRLSVRQLLALAGIVLASYGVVLYLQWPRDPAAPGIELLEWSTLAVVLVWFSVMAGYISRMRRELEEGNANLRQALATIERLAAHDELTGVFNRRRITESIHLEIARSARYGGLLSLCLLDIDHFKRINDRFGHAAGDEVLRRVAQAAQATLRATDVFGRWGGEEFLLVLPHTPVGSAQTVAERVRTVVAALGFAALGEGFRVTVSVGVAEHRPKEDWSATVERADAALYRAKQAGRDRAVIAA